MKLLEEVEQHWEEYKKKHGDTEESREAFYRSLAPVLREALRRELVKAGHI